MIIKRYQTNCARARAREKSGYWY